MVSIDRKELRRWGRLLVAVVVVLAGLVFARSDVARAEGRSDPESVGYVLGPGPGRARTLAFPGAANTFPAGINDRGEIVGSYNTQSTNNPDAGSKGFLLETEIRHTHSRRAMAPVAPKRRDQCPDRLTR